MEVNSFEEFMAIATGLVTIQKSRKFLKCCVFVHPLYDDLVVPGHLIIVHGWPLWTSLSSIGDFIAQEKYYHPWTSFLLLGWFLILLALLALDNPFGRTGVGLIFHFPIIEVAHTTWNNLQTVHEGTKAVKINKLQQLTTRFESIWMSDDESFDEFYAKLNNIVNSAYRVRLDWAYCCWNWKLKTENWKHCSKIIFKCVKSIVGPIFNIFLVHKQ